MARGDSNDADAYWHPKGLTERFNVRYKDQSLDLRVRAQFLKGIAVAEIDWIYIIDAKRHATPEEIKRLCAGTYTR